MKQLTGRYVTDTGLVVFNENGLEQLILEKKLSPEVLVEKTYETELFNDQLKKFESFEINFFNGELDLENLREWNTPEPYKSLDVEEYVFGLSKTVEEDERIALELSLYSERDLYPLLRHIIYLVSVFRENKILWGVGRGSSVSSYVLFLIGIHKINSLKYGLMIEDFLK